MNSSSAYQDELLTNSWKRSWGNLASYPNDLLRDTIIWKYTEPRRYYHNISHLIGCIQAFKSIYYLAEQPFMVELAIWLHDVECNPKSVSNEHDSVQFLINEVLGNEEYYFGTRGGYDHVINSVQKLVLSTQHSLAYDQGSMDEKLICDIDLITLGADEYTFKQYCNKLRAEYSIYSDSQYYKNRIDILMQFFGRRFVYRTEYFRDKYEHIAIDNIVNEIKILEKLLDAV